jgi:hypothetical protein
MFLRKLVLAMAMEVLVLSRSNVNCAQASIVSVNRSFQGCIYTPVLEMGRNMSVPRLLVRMKVLFNVPILVPVPAPCHEYLQEEVYGKREKRWYLCKETQEIPATSVSEFCPHQTPENANKMKIMVLVSCCFRRRP